MRKYENQKMLSISKKYMLIMTEISNTLKSLNENESQYFLNAIIEKYQRDKQMGLFNTNGIVQPVFQPVAQIAVQIPASQLTPTQPTPSVQQPTIIVQEQTAEEIAEPLQENKQETLPEAKHEVSRVKSYTIEESLASEENKNLASSMLNGMNKIGIEDEDE